MPFMKQYRRNLKRSNKQQGTGGWYMSNHGFTPFHAFFLFGIIFMIIVFLSWATMRYPDQVDHTSGLGLKGP
jgi:hypothetical protein